MTTPSNGRKTVSFADHQHDSYARLYRAVIRRAVQDLSQNEHQDEAREWLLSADSDHAFATAGISAQSLRPQMI